MRDVVSNAVVSDDGVYRYSLERSWAVGPRACWIMLNPSTADARTDDPTIRRCIAFSKSWGYGALEVVNLYAYRATDPTGLKVCPAPLGPDNRKWTEYAIARSNLVIAAWGASLPFGWASTLTNGRQHLDIPAMVAAAGRTLYCLGTTKAGFPRHPLYVKGDTDLVPFGAAHPEVTP